VLLPYGVDSARFTPPTVSLSDRRFRVLFVGNVSIRKGIEYLLEAWKKWPSEEAELIVAGGFDPEIGRVIRQDLGRVRFLGNVPFDTLHALYRSVDVLVLPSLSEAFGLVVLEAMASGVPVLVTRNCGAPVRDGIDGFVVATRDPGAIAERLEVLRRDPSLRRRLGMAARERVVAGYTWQHYRRRLAAAYVALTNGLPVQEAIDRA